MVIEQATGGRPNQVGHPDDSLPMIRRGDSRWAWAMCVLLVGCSRGEAAVETGEVVAARRAADMVHEVLAADRAIYTREVVQRLTGVQKVQVIDAENGAARPLEAREDWRSEHGALPLPAQMFRLGAEAVLKQESGLSYLLLSPWPINRQNRARTDVEERGLELVTRSREPHYASEDLDGRAYFVAIYPDVAVSPACVSCHNAHPDSPRRDFAEGDVMGAVVIRFPLE